MNALIDNSYTVTTVSTQYIPTIRLLQLKVEQKCWCRFGWVTEIMRNIARSLQMVCMLSYVPAQVVIELREREEGHNGPWLANYSAPSVSLCGVDCGLLSPNRNYNGNFKEFNPLSPGSPLQCWDILSTPHHRLTIITPGSTNTTFIVWTELANGSFLQIW